MAAIPYMQFHIADYLADTQGLTTIEHGAYLLLIMNYYQTGQSLVDNDRVLAQFCRVSVQKWLRMKPTIEKFFSICEGRWRHKRIENDLNQIAKKSIKSRNAALSRWAKNRGQDDDKTECERNANAMRTQCERNAINNNNNNNNKINNINKNSAHVSSTQSAPPEFEGRSTIEQFTDRLNYFFSDIQIQKLLTSLQGRLMLKTWEQEGVTSTHIETVLQSELDCGQELKSPRYYENIILDFSRTKALRGVKEKKMSHDEKIKHDNSLAVEEAMRRAKERGEIQHE